MLPTLFLSHGAPTLPLTDSPARSFLAGLGALLPRPKAILVASAHWETAGPRVSAPGTNRTIHDFSGFPPELYAMQYPAPPAPALAEHAVALLGAAGLAGAVDHVRGLDHGAWVPLLLMYPRADIPVAQISLQHGAGPGHHLKLGQALAALRQDDVLVIGSGSFTHDLRRFFAFGPDDPVPSDVTAFAAWCDAAIAADRVADLLAYRRLAPHAVENHPTEEHLLPLFVALGAAGDDARPERLHTSAQHGVLRMDAYAFH